MLLSVSRIWDKAKHNAFPDLIDYQGSFFVAFRESDAHDESENGVVRILKSHNGKEWDSISTLRLEGVDLRDPKFSLMPDGRLMLNIGGAIYRENQYHITYPIVAFSSDGMNWSEIQVLDMPGHWIWRVTWHKHHGYGVSYHPIDPSKVQEPWIATLMETEDGIHYSSIVHLHVPDHPTETTLRFLPDGSMIALLRRQGNGWIGHSTAPYTHWTWSDSGTRLGGPNFLILPNGDMWAASRLIEKQGNKIVTYTALGPMTLQTYRPTLILPSGGDTSYPGMAYRVGKMYICYYSSHEEQACIYFAEIALS